MSQKPADLTPQDFPKPSWEPNKFAEALKQLFDYSAGEAKRAIEWYAIKRAPKQLSGRVLRVGAIVATAAAGIIPVLSQNFRGGWQTQSRAGVVHSRTRDRRAVDCAGQVWGLHQRLGALYGRTASIEQGTDRLSGRLGTRQVCLGRPGANSRTNRRNDR